jgi:hypothetical protein
MVISQWLFPYGHIPMVISQWFSPVVISLWSYPNGYLPMVQWLFPYGSNGKFSKVQWFIANGFVRKYH